MKKQRTLKELKQHLSHYLSIVRGLKPNAVPTIQQQINKLKQQIRELEAKENNH